MFLFNKKKKTKQQEVLTYPWHKYYEKDKRGVITPNNSIYDYFHNGVSKFEYLTAINYFGVKITYKELDKKIDLFARSLISQGVRKGDTVTICMPNTPEAVIAFYAVNKVGAIANMVHPLSAPNEIKESIEKTKTVLLIIINIAYKNICDFIEETNVYKTIICSPSISMPNLLSVAYQLTKEWKLDIPDNEFYISWNDFIKRGEKYHVEFPSMTSTDAAVYLHSGGTTGIPKNIVLTNGNVNSLMEQAKIIFPNIGTDDTFLSILPMFHCFGLVVCIAAPLIFGSTAVLVPQFDATRFDKLIKKYKPTILLGVPTLFEALVKNPYMINVDLSYIKYVVSGGDSLSKERNKVVNEFLEKHNCDKHVMQGYGMTETTGPTCIGSFGSDKLGSIGIPLPGNIVKIVNPQTKEEMKPGEIGEIIMTGPTVMKEYLDNKEATDNMIMVDEDNTRWVTTGDMAYMDEDGVIFFVQRMKRMLIVSGYNVYPSYIEEIINSHPDVLLCGVIGVPHPYKVQVPKAFVILNDGVEPSAEEKQKIKSYCEEKMAKYMLPKEIEFREALPKTMIGKIDYRKLEELIDIKK